MAFLCVYCFLYVNKFPVILQSVIRVACVWPYIAVLKVMRLYAKEGVITYFCFEALSIVSIYGCFYFKLDVVICHLLRRSLCILHNANHIELGVKSDVKLGIELDIDPRLYSSYLWPPNLKAKQL